MRGGAGAAIARHAGIDRLLPPKGACWYCDKPLDAVRRFCGKTCGVAYAEEAQYNP
jgi:predicted nucleic acid-binding Zn ribbon protein